MVIKTHSGIRLTLKSSVDHPRWNWVLIPGGPGMGSEYFDTLFPLLQGPFAIWALDLPGNGSNQTEKIIDYSKWSDMLVEVFDHLDHVIFLGHSFGGMLLLDCPAIESRAVALVLMSTVPETIFNGKQESYLQDPRVKRALVHYSKQPSDQMFQQMLIALAPCYFKPAHLNQGLRMFQQMSYAHLAYDDLKMTFLKTYRARYVPKIPTLVISGDSDWVTPLHYFERDIRFQKPWITLRSIPQGNHFPWVDNPEDAERFLIEWAQAVLTLDI